MIAFLTGLLTGFIGSPVSTAYVINMDCPRIPFGTVISALYAKNLALFTLYGVVGAVSCLVSSKFRAVRMKGIDRRSNTLEQS